MLDWFEEKFILIGEIVIVGLAIAFVALPIFV
jgi:hypothetical protein